MRASICTALVLILGAVGLGACATAEQWTEIHKHPTWFASNAHLGFSWRNQGEAPRVSRKDQRLAAAGSFRAKTTRLSITGRSRIFRGPIHERMRP